MRRLTLALAVFLLVPYLAFSADPLTVTRVINGNTLQLSSGEQVRLIGISVVLAEEYQEKAVAFVRQLIESKQVRLEFDTQERDKQGRLWAYAWFAAPRSDVMPDWIYVDPNHGGAFLNATLIKAGYAKAIVIQPNVKYQKLFLDLQKEATKEKRGFWWRPEAKKTSASKPKPPEWTKTPIAIEIFDGNGVVGVGRLEFDGWHFQMYLFRLRAEPAKWAGLKLVKTTDAYTLREYKKQSDDDIYVVCDGTGFYNVMYDNEGSFPMYKGHLVNKGNYFVIDVHETLSIDAMSTKTFQRGMRSITQEGIAWKNRYIPNVDLMAESFKGKGENTFVFEQVIG